MAGVFLFESTLLFKRNYERIVAAPEFGTSSPFLVHRQEYDPVEYLSFSENYGIIFIEKEKGISNWVIIFLPFSSIKGEKTYEKRKLLQRRYRGKNN